MQIIYKDNYPWLLAEKENININKIKLQLTEIYIFPLFQIRRHIIVGFLNWHEGNKVQSQILLLQDIAKSLNPEPEFVNIQRFQESIQSNRFR